MGLCATKQKLTPAEEKRLKEERIKSKWIEQSLVKEEKREKDAIKLLFLGAGESGKSTFLKQMTIINGKGFTKEDRESYVRLIESNILQTMRTLVEQLDALVEQGLLTKADAAISDASVRHKERIEDMKFDDRLDNKAAASVKALWAEPAVQRVYELRSKFQLSDSAKYFLDAVDRVVRPDYLPTVQDILRARIRTTGIVEHNFDVNGNEFRMYDVGGQRNARKKWIHCFENVTSVMFVAALSGYDQTLYEDNVTNRIMEALDLFMDIAHSRWFRQTSIILFLNKKDIFREKLCKTPLTVAFPEYAGNNSYRNACMFMKSEFRKRNPFPNKRIYVHFTCATDTTNIRKVFVTVKAIILRTHLLEIGLMDDEEDDEAHAPHKDHLSDDDENKE